jgi:flagellar hook-length control protein FliK
MTGPEAQAPATAARSTNQPTALPELGRGAQDKAPQVASRPSSEGASPAMLERAQEILRQIELHLAPGVRRLTLDLEPAELGRLAVQLSLRRGKLAAIVRAESAQALELLQARAGELRELFARQGLELDSLRLALGFGGERAGAGARDRAAASPADAASPVRPAPGTQPVQAAPHTTRPSTSLLDTYA